MKRAFFLATSFSLVALGAACGGGTASPTVAASVSGTFGGKPVVSTDSIATHGQTTAAAGNVAYFAAFIANVPGVCSIVQENASKANADVLALFVLTNGSTPQPPIAAGTYSVTNGAAARDYNGNRQTVWASYNSTDVNCQTTIADTAARAVAGTITIGAIGASSISGSFDLTFPDGDHLTGSFDSPVCNFDPIAPPTVSNGASAPACHP